MKVEGDRLRSLGDFVGVAEHDELTRGRIARLGGTARTAAAATARRLSAHRLPRQARNINGRQGDDAKRGDELPFHDHFDIVIIEE